MLIDSHVNLHSPQFAEDQAQVIERARAAGIGRMITICDRVASFPAVRAIAEAHDDIWCSVGTHPHEAKDDPGLTAETLIDLAAYERVVGIGETGLDFYYDLSPRVMQAQVFRAHIVAAREAHRQAATGRTGQDPGGKRLGRGKKARTEPGISVRKTRCVLRQV